MFTTYNIYVHVHSLFQLIIIYTEENEEELYRTFEYNYTLMEGA